MAASRKFIAAASAAVTATGNNGSIAVPDRAVGVHLVLDITAVSGTNPTLDVKLQRYDPASAKWVDLTSAAWAQKTGTGTSDLTVYPGIAETANLSVSDVMTEELRIVWTIGGTATPTFTFSIGGTWLP
jgi:hypothetical protein